MVLVVLTVLTMHSAGPAPPFKPLNLKRTLNFIPFP